MPAKKRFLPRPCPICGKENGTVQIIIFSTSKSVTCRIGHYDSEMYLNPYTKREKSRRGKRWCSFKINKLFAQENIIPFERDLEDLMRGRFGKSIQYTNPCLLLETIKEEGWHGEGNSFFRGLTKTLGLWEEFTKDHFPLSDDETYQEFIIRKKPNEKL